MRISTFKGAVTTESKEAFLQAKAIRQNVTGTERHLDSGAMLVSKTDVGGLITYVNSEFLKISGYEEHEVLGAPHSIIRHPAMPRSVFKLLWETISKGEEVFAYVINRAKCGDHYWVFAHVTPTVNRTGKIIGFHSNRRAPSRTAIDAISPLYDAVNVIEKSHDRYGVERGLEFLLSKIAKSGLSYSDFIFSI